MRRNKGRLSVPPGAHELGVIAVIVFLVVAVRGEDHAHRAGREVIELAPDHRADIESVVGAIEMKAGLVFAVVEDDVEAAGHGNDELMQRFMRMPSPLRSARHVVEVINTLDVEGDMLTAFDESEIASRIVDFGEIDDFAIGDGHGRLGDVWAMTLSIRDVHPCGLRITGASRVALMGALHMAKAAVSIMVFDYSNDII